jgi:hypothetical protein
MSTDSLCEVQDVATIGFVFTQPMTSTLGDVLMLDEVPQTAGLDGAANFWSVVSTTQPARYDGVEAALREFSARIMSVPDVVAVTYTKERHAHLVWTFIWRRDKAVRSRIYVVERWLMDSYPRLTFDFNVVSLNQQHAGSLVPDDLQGRVVMYRPRT